MADERRPDGSVVGGHASQGSVPHGGWVPRAVRAAADEYAWAHPEDARVPARSGADGDDEPPRRTPTARRVRWAVPWRVAGAAGLAVALVVGAVALRAVALSPGAAVELPEPAPLGTAVPTDGPAPAPAPGVVVVHVVGAVAAPGVVRLPLGARVVDALAAAGGAAPDADLARVNLARVLADGEQIQVPRPGDPAPEAPAAGSAPDDGAVDLNTASLAQLDGLPGVGPVLAQRIVDRRPFTSVDELDEVPGIGQAMLVRLRPLVHA